MSVWATERKFIYISIAIAIFLIVIAFPSYYFLYKPPTCFDGKQDQGEQGVDCGGPCARLCPAAALDPVIHWARVFPSGISGAASQNQYDAVAYVENANLGSYAQNVPYQFDLYDASGVLIAERKGTINIWANSKFPVFEPNISTGNSTAASVTFQFTAEPIWLTVPLVFPQVSVTSPVLSKTDTLPRLNATIADASLTAVEDLPVVAILYGADGNALAVSRTVVTYLQTGAPQHIFFTWPAPFSTSTPVSTIDIIPLVSPSGVATNGQ